MKIRVLLICLGLSMHLFSQESQYEKGKIIDSVSIKSKSGESYALYLPSGFDPSSENAVLFIFDPAARGALAIKPFVEASEKYNLILLCSNNSRNAAYAENFDIAERWFNEVLSNFKIDQNQIYAAGFSGGSRLASTIGVLSGLFKGVIGCGAAFSANPAQAPYSSDHFNYVGIVGDLDMNYHEMFRAKEWLDRLGLTNQLLTFNGDHRWPDADLILNAFDWFKLQDYLKGGIRKDEVFLKEYVSTQLSIAQKSVKNGQSFRAVQIYEKTLQDLAGEIDLDSITVKVNQLKGSTEFKKAKKEANSIADLETRWRDKLIGKIRNDLEKRKIPNDFKWWQKELGKLDEDYTKSDVLIYQNMGQRLQSMIFAVCIENLQAAVAQKNKFEVEYYSALMQANWSDNAFVYYRTAVAFASLGDDDIAMGHLEEAIVKGWENKQWILNTKAFDHLRNNDRFLELIERLQ